MNHRLLPILAALLVAACGSEPYLRALNPLQANWDIEEIPLEGKKVQILLRMKPYYAGGSSEAHALFEQRAGEIARLNECQSYQVLHYRESLESAILGSRRSADGIILLKKASD